MQTNAIVELVVTEPGSFPVGARGKVCQVLNKETVLVYFDGDRRPCPQIVSVARLKVV